MTILTVVQGRKVDDVIENEGNQKDFEYKGYKCHIERHLPRLLGFLNGYMVLPRINWLAKNQREIDDFDVHGGVSYIGKDYWNDSEFHETVIWI